MTNKQESLPEDFKAVKDSAKKGDAEAQFQLASIYDSPRRLSQDPQKAYHWARKAAEQGHPRAQLLIGLFYEYGRGARKNSNEALIWIRKAAEQGHAGAQGYLSDRYATGQGIEQDYDKAFFWAQKAADQDNPLGYKILGYLYEMGKGVNKDTSKSDEYYQKYKDLDLTAERKRPRIGNHELHLEKIPIPDSPMGDLIDFGQNTFNGFTVHGSFGKCSEIAIATLTKERDPITLTDLRTALFFLIRKDRHTGEDGNHDLIRDLVHQIREKVANGNID